MAVCLCLQKCSGQSLSTLPECSIPWESDEYMRPALQDDPLLQIGTGVHRFIVHCSTQTPQFNQVQIKGNCIAGIFRMFSPDVGFCIKVLCCFKEQLEPV